MGGDDYLDGLPPEQAAELTRINKPGLTALRDYLASGQAVAFLGAGVSAPLYPLWTGLIGELVDAAAARLDDRQAQTCRALASQSPEEVVEIVRTALGAAVYREALRQVLRARTDPESGRSWTPVQELVCRCAFTALATTNYDPGIVNARMRVRPDASPTGFTTWEDELGLDQWRTGDVFGADELPVLFAHGQHSRGVFGWSFYADPSAEHWTEGLLDWAGLELGIANTGARWPAEAVLSLLRGVPLLLVLDGLEVVQEGPAGDGFGRLLDGALREVLAGACQQEHGGLVLLTSRFPFADLEGFDGGTARMLEVPAFTPAEGAALLAASGGGWLPEEERRDLVRAVDGHALATGVLAGLLAGHVPVGDLAVLHAELDTAARTDVRVGKVLGFYADRLAEADRYPLAAVSLFARPVDAGAVLAVTGHDAFGSRLARWTPAMLQAAVRGRLAGLAAWHPDGPISAHPLVRDAFRPLVMAAAGIAADTVLAGMPGGTVTSRADALRVAEVIELLLPATSGRPPTTCTGIVATTERHGNTCRLCRTNVV